MLEHVIEVGETSLGKLNLTFLEKGNKNIGPTVVFVSGIHGAEVSSVGGLLSFLEELDTIPDSDVSGRIIAFPFANPIALLQKTWGFKLSPLDFDENLNRLFPGDPNGSLGEQMAHAIFKFIMKRAPRLVVDLHTMNSRSLPFVIVDRMRDPFSIFEADVMSDAGKFGIGVVYEMPPEEYDKEGLNKSLSGALCEKHIYSFTVEVPSATYALPESEEIVRAGLWNIIYGMNMMKKEEFEPSLHPTRELIGVGIHQRYLGPRAKRAGFFRPAVFPGDWVSEKHEMGKIYNGSAKVIEAVLAPTSGYVSDIIEASFVSSGDQLFEMMVP